MSRRRRVVISTLLLVGLPKPEFELGFAGTPAIAVLGWDNLRDHRQCRQKSSIQAMAIAALPTIK